MYERKDRYVTSCDNKETLEPANVDIRLLVCTMHIFLRKPRGYAITKR